jgi:segregation and condensation protein B
MERDEQLRIVEALVVGAAEPIGASRIADIAPGLGAADVRRCVEELNASYEEQGRAFEIWEVAGGYQLRTRPVYAGYLQQLVKDRPLRLSRAALETLAVVAYKQPATRAEIEHVRGVDVGAVLRSLVERRLLRMAGHREVPGRPILYGTTRRFLEVFGLATLKDLPTLRELEDLVPPGVVEEPEPEGEETVVAVAPAEEAPSAEPEVPEVLH